MRKSPRELVKCENSAHDPSSTRALLEMFKTELRARYVPHVRYLWVLGNSGILTAGRLGTSASVGAGSSLLVSLYDIMRCIHIANPVNILSLSYFRRMQSAEIMSEFRFEFEANRGPPPRSRSSRDEGVLFRLQNAFIQIM